MKALPDNNFCSNRGRFGGKKDGVLSILSIGLALSKFYHDFLKTFGIYWV